jgi:hypothetical protein
MTHSWGRRLAPMLALQAFLWFTYTLFVYGPWRWPLSNPGQLYLFLTSAHLALLLGYLSAAHRAPTTTLAMKCDPEKLMKTSLWLTLALLPFTSYARTGRWIPDIIGGLMDPGKAYEQAQIYTENSANFAAYLRVLASPWLVVLFPLGFYLWKRLSWHTRWLMMAAMLIVIVMSIATGQRRDIADLMVTTPFIIAAAHWSKVSMLKRQTIVVGLASLCVLVIAFTSYFTYSHVSRVGKEAASHGANPVTRQAPDLDNAILCILPADIRPGMLGLVNYLTTGYYGLGLALDRPVKPMYGAGHSMFLTRNVARLANEPYFESRSLPVQISDKDGFRYPVIWCTAYPYFANDLGWLGTVLMLFLVGRALALAWTDMLGGKNAYAVVFFSLLMTLVFYLPATNRMLQDGEGVVAFYTWLALWMGSRIVLRRSPAMQTA